MNNQCPQVSTILAVYNGENYIKEAVQSVLSQEIKSLEFIIIDDGSTDGTAEQIQSLIAENNTDYPIRFYQQKNQGVAAAQNDAIRLARGDFLTFIDADDLWMSDKLAKQLAVLEAQPQLDMVFGHAQLLYSPELTVTERSRIYCPTEIIPVICVVAICIKKSAFHRVGSFDETWNKGPFIDWFAKAVEKGLTHRVLPDLVYRRRLHKNNMGFYRRDSYGDYARILKKMLDRRRQIATKKEGI